MADDFLEQLDHWLEGTSVTVEQHRIEAERRQQEQAEADLRRPRLWEVEGTLMADAEAKGWPTAGTFRAWVSVDLLGPLVIRPFDVWTKECCDCGGDFLLLARPGSRLTRASGPSRCRGCQRKAVQEQWRRYKRNQRAAVAPDLTTTCPHCGTTFTPKRRSARFCSTRCRVAAHRAAAQAQPELRLSGGNLPQ